MAFDSMTGRYHVRLADGGVRAIRPPHVVARKPPKEQAAFKKGLRCLAPGVQPVGSTRARVRAPPGTLKAVG